jgi:hypothetical protein
MFDVVTPGRVPGDGPRQSYRLADDWAVLVTAEESIKRRLITRHIASFRRSGAHYHRNDETHRQRLFDSRDLAERLRRVGFRVRRLRGYGEFMFPPGVAGFLARTPLARTARHRHNGVNVENPSAGSPLSASPRRL